MDSIIWEGECPHCRDWDKWPEVCRGVCILCNGTGVIVRDATLEEVTEFAKRVIGRYMFSSGEIQDALTINGGTLKVKEA